MKTFENTMKYFRVGAAGESIGSLPITRSYGHIDNHIPHISMSACNFAQGRWSTCLECLFAYCVKEEKPNFKKRS
jgi:hypothetical protein